MYFTYIDEVQSECILNTTYLFKIIILYINTYFYIYSLGNTFIIIYYIEYTIVYLFSHDTNNNSRAYYVLGNYSLS